MKPSAQGERPYTVALVGNPNVGKSTVFNALTGLHQHTGNWPGKTVELAQGQIASERHRLRLFDLPGAYSLLSHSAEEDVTRDFLAFERVDLAVVVCDATCLSRHMNLVRQVMEVAPRTVVCVNLLDEAQRKGVRLSLSRLSQNLGVPVVGTVARSKRSLSRLIEAIDNEIDNNSLQNSDIPYPIPIREAITQVKKTVQKVYPSLGHTMGALRLLEGDGGFLSGAVRALGEDITALPSVAEATDRARRALFHAGYTAETLREAVADALEAAASQAAEGVITLTRADVHRRDRRIDAVLTGRLTAFPVLLVFLGLIFFLTVYAASFPSAALSSLFAEGERLLGGWLLSIGMPQVLYGLLIEGVYRVSTWVIAVMLPPMAIFFPLFTLLEDVGYLPRIAYNLDRPFACCHACGKQALTMCMGFGCNAVGVTGCRIIDSPRERRLAVLTNSLVPCNGRFPTLIALLTVFFVGTRPSFGATAAAAGLLSATVVLSVGATLLVTWLLSVTLMRGEASSFTLELPPYRRPQLGRILLRSLLDRTLFVLGRAVAVAAPAGLVLWVVANVTVGDATLLGHAAGALDPIGRFFGMDGIILIAFLLGFPAGETVVPIMLMGYLSTGTLQEASSLADLEAVLVSAGWTYKTAVCTVIFCLFHFPCSTTLLTVAKETRSARDTLLAAAVPTVLGLLHCALVNLLLP